ncbi:hypothetical protein DMENIID0001_032550 [Sergentomyia squamirostris]
MSSDARRTLWYDPVAIVEMEHITSKFIISGCDSCKNYPWEEINCILRMRNKSHLMLREIKADGDKKRMEQSHLSIFGCLLLSNG